MELGLLLKVLGALPSLTRKAGGTAAIHPGDSRDEFMSAGARIRTWGPLRDEVLNLAPLAGLGYPRVAPVARRAYKETATGGRVDMSGQALCPP